ncbi:MAG: hypothetical protein D6686_02365 [Alphaproteobacteria bacterium]|nr:MAG: hypothetical protein D6686_02365 [Alphaproteobacteria bacterium]
MRRLWRGAGAALVGLAVIATLAAAALAWRLAQGPVELPFLAAIVEREIAPRVAPLRLSVGGVVFATDRGTGDGSGLRLTGVTLHDADGALLLAAPQMGARLRLSDLVRGRLNPTELAIWGADVRLTRHEDGALRLSLPGEAVAADPARREGVAFAAFVAALEAGRIPLLRRLERIRLNGIDITYRDRVSGRVWLARDGRAVLRRERDRLEGELRLVAAEPGGPPTRLAIDVRHSFGADHLALSARLDGARPDDIADQLPALGFLRPLAAPVSGTVSLELGLEGALVTLLADLEAGPGQLRPGEGPPIPLSRARLVFSIDARRDRLWLSLAEARTGIGRLRATGEATIRRSGDLVEGLDARLDVAALTVELPGRLAAPVAFDGGAARLSLDLEPFAIAIDEARLTRGAAAYGLSGRIARANEAWQADLAFDGDHLDIGQVLALWPVTAAPHAREWVAARIPRGEVERVTGRLRLGAGAPEFDLGFAFRDAEARVLADLPPIEEAAGEGRLDLTRFEIRLASGRVTPLEGQPIDLAGSVFAIPDMAAAPPRAQVTLRGKGGIGAMMALIDMPPLGLPGRIGLAPDIATGRAEVAARLAFPLLRDLTPAQVAAELSAELSDVRVGLDAPLPLSADRLRLDATAETLELSGPMRVGPVTADLRWRQVFRPAPGAPGGRLEARLPLTPALMSALGAEDLAAVIGGSAPAVLTATPAGDGTGFTIEADLGSAALRLPGLGWRKPPGTAGRLRLAGRLEGGGRPGGIRLDEIALSAGPLELAGSARLAPDGRLVSARVARLKLGEALDSTLEWDEAGLRLRGGVLDLAALGAILRDQDAPDPAAGPAEEVAPRASPPRLDLALDRLAVTSRLALTPAQGVVEAVAADGPFLTARGPANGGVEVTLSLARAAEGGLTARLTTADAGRFLRDTGYFRGGEGGALTLDLALSPDGDDITGRAVIDRFTVRDAPVLGRILSVASITGPLEMMTTGGLTFDRVRADFRRSGGRIRLTDGRATGPSLGITIAGTYDETADRLDLAGVFSPAYLLNSLLGEVPLIGRILTGRRGEGVFGFSYRVTGSATNPEVRVNPLSILAPGVLRGVLTNPPAQAPATRSEAPELPPAPPRPGRAAEPVHSGDDEFDR